MIDLSRYTNQYSDKVCLQQTLSPYWLDLYQIPLAQHWLYHQIN